jgi:SulP family sulfate permease
VAWRLINFSQIIKILRADINEAAVLSVTFLSTLFLKLEFAILFGVILSLMIFLRRTSRPKLDPRVPDPDSRHRKFKTGVTLPECPQLKILRLEDSLYFGSVSHVGELLRRYREHYPEQRNLFLLTKGINQIDVAGAELLVSEARARREMGGDLYMYRLKDKAARVMDRGGYTEEIKTENFFDSKSEAISGIFEKLDKDICATCTNRIFLECGAPDPSSRRKTEADA